MKVNIKYLILAILLVSNSSFAKNFKAHEFERMPFFGSVGCNCECHDEHDEEVPQDQFNASAGATQEYCEKLDGTGCDLYEIGPNTGVNKNCNLGTGNP